MNKATLCAALALGALALSACRKDDTSPSQTTAAPAPTPPPTPVAPLAPEPPKFTIEARVRTEVDARAPDGAPGSPIALGAASLTAPAGWAAAKSGTWSTSTSADQRARLAAGAIGAADNGAAKANEAAAALTLSGCQWGTPEAVTVGKDKLPGTAADGICKRAGADARAAYVALAGAVNAVAVVGWDVGADSAPLFSTLRSTVKAVSGPDAIAACCNALQGNMASAPPEQKFAYAAAIAACNAVRSSPEGRAALGGVRAALAGANMPAACR